MPLAVLPVRAETAPQMLKDINTSVFSLGSNPENLCAVANLIFFTATDGVQGLGLWVSDGTEAGTVRLHNPEKATPKYHGLVSAGGILYFSVGTSYGGTQMWKSDGTKTGTVLVRDFSHPDCTSPLGFGTGSAAVSGKVYFLAATRANGYQIWESDGTADGTRTVTDVFRPDGASVTSGFAVVDDTLFYECISPRYGRELWKFDTVTSNAQIVKDINSGIAGSDPTRLTPVGHRLLFSAADAKQVEQIWTTDGTEAGTQLLTSTRREPMRWLGPEMVSHGSHAYFNAASGAQSGIWKSDGTTAGTVLTSYNSVAQNLAIAVGRLYFTSPFMSGGWALWSSDMNMENITKVLDMSQGPAGDSETTLQFAVISGRVFFTVLTGPHTYALYEANGVTGGAQLLKSFTMVNMISMLPALVSTQDRLYFASGRSLGQLEPWTSDGAPGGTLLLKNIHRGSNGSQPSDLIKAGE